MRPRAGTVLSGSSGQALAFGPGHVERTPRAGEPGTAHRDTHFAFLGKIVIGDDIVVTRQDGAVLHFRIEVTEVVPWDASGIDPHAPGRALVLTTCWPLDAKFAGTLRYLVHARLVGGS